MFKSAICENCEKYDPPSNFCYRKGHYVAKDEWYCGFIRKEEKEMPNNIITIKDMSIGDLMKLKNDIISEIENRERESYANAVKAIVKSIDELTNNSNGGSNIAIEIGTIDGHSDEKYCWEELKYMIKTTHFDIDF